MCVLSLCIICVLRVYYLYSFKRFHGFLSIVNYMKKALYKACLGLNTRPDIFTNYLVKASSTATATATVAPTIGLLPIPIRPIIST